MANTKKIKNPTRKSNKSELTLNIINQANEEQFPTKEIEIIVGDKPYSVKIDQNFRVTKIEKMIKNLVNSKNIEEFKKYDQSIQLSYYFYLIIKNFSNLDIPDDLEFEQEINFISSLVDLNIMSTIIENIPEEEIKKINDYLQIVNINLNNELEELKKNKVIEDVENVEDFTFNENIIESVEIIEGDGDGK